MPNVFPIGLNQKPRAGTYSESGDDALVRSPVEMGAPRQRRRYSKAVKYITGVWDLNEANNDVTTLMNFFENTCKLGQDSFFLNHPRTGVSTEFYFVERPVPSHVLGKRYAATLTLRLA